MSAETQPQRATEPSLFLAISNAMVSLMREYTGRGPTKARTSIRDNVVVVVLEHTLTRGERVLADKGRGDTVLALRREYQEAMREAASARIAEIAGRDVVAMMSANHLDPDLSVEIFVLDGPPVRLAVASRARETEPRDGQARDGQARDGQARDGQPES